MLKRPRHTKQAYTNGLRSARHTLRCIASSRAHSQLPKTQEHTTIRPIPQAKPQTTCVHARKVRSPPSQSLRFPARGPAPAEVRQRKRVVFKLHIINPKNCTGNAMRPRGKPGKRTPTEAVTDNWPKTFWGDKSRDENPSCDTVPQTS